MINKNVVKLFVLFIVLSLSYAEVFYNFKKEEDPCYYKCKDTYNKDPGFDRKYIASCCQRGCRFFNLVDLRRQLELINLNNTLDSCYASCDEAYSVQSDSRSCRVGCGFMANQRVSGVTSLFSIAINIEDGVHPNILLMSPDIPENDMLSDAGLGKELFPGWWDTNGFKLPETYFKTIPFDSGSVDYSISSEYVSENEKSTSIPGSDWLQCASRHTGIPRWILAFAIATAALSALWLCLSPEKPNEPFEKITLVKPSSPSKITVYLPDEAPLYKKPPPKYHEIVDMNDPNLQANLQV